MGKSIRQFRPLLLALGLGGVFTAAIAVATVYVTWPSTKPATGDNHVDGMRFGSTPTWFREVALEEKELRAVRWVDGPFFHAAIVTRHEQPASEPREMEVQPGRLTDSFIRAGFPWPWLERHDESIAKTLFAAENPWLKPEHAPEYMVVEESFQPGFAIDYQYLIADILFFAAIILGFLALAWAIFRGSPICWLPPWVVAALSFGVVLPIVFAWASGMMIVSPMDDRSTLVNQGWIVEEESYYDFAVPFLKERAYVPGGSRTTLWRRADEDLTVESGSFEMAPYRGEIRLGWPVPIARSKDPIQPLMVSTWKDVFLGFRDGGYIELDHASIWKVMRAPVVWTGWFLNWLAWSVFLALVLAPLVAARRWQRKRAGCCIGCGHRLAGADRCFECGRTVERRRIKALLGAMSESAE